jgi:transcriptional/translational regulatory protein YebC/TACO1
MAGHSKWAKVKHFKGAIDAKRAKIFSKLAYLQQSHGHRHREN